MNEAEQRLYTILGVVCKIIGGFILLILFVIGLAVISPYFFRAHNGRPISCLNQLREINDAKRQWALDNQQDTNATPTSTSVAPYLKNNKFPGCPQGGTYTIGRVGVNPTCSVPGHVLPTP